MHTTDLIILNFEEIRRRSLKIWNSIPKELYSWKPDAKALSCRQMVSHVLEGEHLFHRIVMSRGNLGDYLSPWEGRTFVDIGEELQFAENYRAQFLDTMRTFSAEDLEEIEIIRPEKGQRRKLGDYLNRIAYHESVHAGQLLAYLRTLGIDRPQIWD